LYKALGGGWQAAEPKEKPESEPLIRPAEYVLQKLDGK
jgi:hypothetical protein